jgi:GT2 family glycosyltransferase
MSLLIVILNYKTAQLTIDCLGSLAQEVSKLPPFTKVAVVDNASADGSSEKIQQAITQNQWQDWTSLIDSPQNGGYAMGNNFAAKSPDNPSGPAKLTDPTEKYEHQK